MVENISYGNFFNHVIGNAFLIRTLIIFFQCRYTYHRDDGGSNVLELDTALMQCADQQLAVFPSVLMLYVVSLNYFFFQHQYHLRSKKQIVYQFFSFFYSIQRRIIYTGSFLNLIFCHQDLIIILPLLPDFIIFSLYLSN